MLKRKGIQHEVLNAKYHGREAQIVAGAGQPAAVTIATNMAGRGTDIKLGKGVTERREVQVDGEQHEELGGLHIIGSERHESRRIDRQLRGRAGRQGDPGTSQFFLSLEDDLMRLFGSDRIAGVMTRMGAEEGEVITHALITRSIGSAQQRVEMQNFEARKRLLDYDDVMNQQREVIYDLRTFALEGGKDLEVEAWDMIENTLERLIEETVPEGSHPDQWELSELKNRLMLDFFLTADRLPQAEDARHDFSSLAELNEYLYDLSRSKFDAQLRQFGMHSEALLRHIVLSTIDERWKDHLYDLDHLKASIGFRGWGQKDPLIEYKKEAYEMFVDLLTDMRSSVARTLFRARLEMAPPPPPPQPSFLVSRSPQPRSPLEGRRGTEPERAPEGESPSRAETGPARRPAAAQVRVRRHVRLRRRSPMQTESTSSGPRSGGRRRGPRSTRGTRRQKT
jgi:preprotein translocase subunit SecA